MNLWLLLSNYPELLLPRHNITTILPHLPTFPVTSTGSLHCHHWPRPPTACPLPVVVYALPYTCRWLPSGQCRPIVPLNRSPPYCKVRGLPFCLGTGQLTTSAQYLAGPPIDILARGVKLPDGKVHLEFWIVLNCFLSHSISSKFFLIF